MRVIAGAFRGRALAAPPGAATRPTAQRARQALFDMLAHAPWAGPALLQGGLVLDVFAGTGALGLEALSRGAAEAVFMEQDRAALAALRANIATLGVYDRVRVFAGNALRPPPGVAQNLIFLDPPYGQDLVPRALAALRAAKWIDIQTLIVAETARYDMVEYCGPILAQRVHGAAKLTVWREEHVNGRRDDPIPAAD